MSTSPPPLTKEGTPLGTTHVLPRTHPTFGARQPLLRRRTRLDEPGAGSQYAYAEHDADSNYLEGRKNYKLHLPPNIPVNRFWSFLVYDSQTRSMFQTDQQFPSIGSQRKGIVINLDRSVDVYFGLKPPPGKESTWVQTVPGKAWWLMLRLYGPLEPWFDKPWRPSEIELVK